ncbi:MAG: sugar kinase [Candidatus Marinimicrobia bacterium]|nr:sugar kinase [Candidatus Neomarinimicrobiota bacterium]
MKTLSTLAVGSIALDTLETPTGSRKNLLGGSATYFSITTALFSPVNLVGIVGTDFPDEAWLLLKDRGVDLANVQAVEGSTFRWGGRYHVGFNGRDTLFTELGVFENFKPAISDGYRSPDIVYLGNIQPRLQLDVLAALSNKPLVISDTMNLWIDNSRDDLLEMLAKTDIFLINNDEASMLTGIADMEEAADDLLGRGPRAVIIKLGAKGALIAEGPERTHVPIYVDAEVIDPTGAGDSFAGGLIGHIALHGQDDLLAAVVTGTAAASYTVQGFGLEGLLSATRESILARGVVVAQTME